ncbi:helix-turn-helix domain-containing protein [Paenibacillus sp. CC-CFT747]|nr:helix-turn-helix domain-containing protein [Paenibacillus sp. CC-CFT747]
MNKTKAELLLHPVRLKIIQSLVGGRRLTVQGIAEHLPEVPQATLYRQLNQLSKGGLLTVVEQNPVRGTVEKVYALSTHAHTLTKEDLEKATPDEHLQLFLSFLAGVISDFEKYVSQESFDMMKDMVTYRQARLHLSDEELREMVMSIGAAITKASSYGPGPGRRARTLTTILLPEKSIPSEGDEKPKADGAE